MKEERMMILSMLQEGKINSEEAVKLLEALEETEPYKDEKDTFIDMDKTKEKMEEIGEVVKKQGKKVEDIGVDLGNKIAKAFSNIKIDKGFGSIVGKTENINTKIQKDISHLEKPIIDIKAVNGEIILENWDEEYLSMEISYRYKEGLLQEDEEFYDFYEIDNKIVFSPKNSGSLSIDLKVYLPNIPYGEIQLNSSNGRLKIDDLIANSFILNTSNGSIIVENIETKEVYANTKNGRIVLDNISSEKIELNTSNARIILSDIDLDETNYIKLSTSNGSIDVELDKINKEIYLDLETSISSIDLEIPNLVYKTNKQPSLGKKNVVAHSVNYNEEEEHLKLLASTSNGSIKIY